MISEKNDRLLGSSGSSKTAEEERTRAGISQGRSSLSPSQGPAALPRCHSMLLGGERASPEPRCRTAKEAAVWLWRSTDGTEPASWGSHRPNALRPRSRLPRSAEQRHPCPRGMSPPRAGRTLPTSGFGLDWTNAPILRTSLGTIEAPLFLMRAMSKKDHRRPICQQRHRSPEDLEPCTSLLLSRNQCAA